MIKDKKPIDYSPSSFVLNCFNNKKFLIQKKGFALDLACGFGRHTIVLNTKGYTVISGDLSIGRLQAIKYETKYSYCLCLDATRNLPFQDRSFYLVVIIHFVDEYLLSNIQRIIEPKGFLIYEAYGGQGNNWKSLPRIGEVDRELSENFDILIKRQRVVGPKDEPRVSLKVLAQRK